MLPDGFFMSAEALDAVRQCALANYADEERGVEGDELEFRDRVWRGRAAVPYEVRVLINEHARTADADLATHPLVAALGAALAGSARAVNTRVVYASSLDVTSAATDYVFLVLRFGLLHDERGAWTRQQWSDALATCADNEYGHLVHAPLRIVAPRHTITDSAPFGLTIVTAAPGALEMLEDPHRFPTTTGGATELHDDLVARLYAEIKARSGALAPDHAMPHPDVTLFMLDSVTAKQDASGGVRICWSGRRVGVQRI